MSVYHGEHNCQAHVKSGAPCQKKAYYSYNGGVYCGIHSVKESRVELPKNPNAEQVKAQSLQDEVKDIQAAILANKNVGRAGSVIVTKMHMMKPVETVKGYLKVFPNYKHGNRTDGFGCPALSPMKLGPVTHIMSGLPPAKNLEGFYQSMKMYAFEVDAENKVKPEALAFIIQRFNDSTPHRHKYEKKLLKEHKQPELPLYSVYYDAAGNPHYFNYFGSRYFYCKKYEELAKQTDEFKRLQLMLAEGYNLQIVGYDGYPVDKPLLECYADVSKPFGHELVLYTLLTVTNPEEYPWNVVYEANKSLYEGVGI